MTNPSNKVALHHPPEVDAEEAELLVYLALFGKGTLSFGKAGEYLGINRVTFLEKAAVHGINIFSDDEDSLEQVLDILP